MHIRQHRVRDLRERAQVRCEQETDEQRYSYDFVFEYSYVASYVIIFMSILGNID